MTVFFSYLVKQHDFHGPLNHNRKQTQSKAADHFMAQRLWRSSKSNNPKGAAVVQRSKQESQEGCH